MYESKKWYEKYNPIRGGVLSVAAFLFFSFAGVVQAASIFVDPSDGTLHVGDTAVFSIYVDTPNDAINAVSGTLTFPSDLLQVVSISKNASILTLWVQEPSYSNTAGTATFEGIAPNPGFTGSSGKIFSVTFRVKGAGVARLAINDGQVLANDGQGTNVFRNSLGSKLTLSAAVVPIPQASKPAPSTKSPTATDLAAHVISSTHPDETKWYGLTHAIFDWTNAQGVSAIRLGYDKNPEGAPGVLYTDPLSHKELDLTDGIWYFHVQEKSSGSWGPVSGYRVQIDTVAPVPFTLTFPNGATTTAENLSTHFATTDDLSGIDHYTLSIDGAPVEVSAEKGSDNYVLQRQEPGTHSLSVEGQKAASLSRVYPKFLLRSLPGAGLPLTIFQ
jgi:hypothetical protein